jgi:hypothetical protein
MITGHRGGPGMHDRDGGMGDHNRRGPHHMHHMHHGNGDLRGGGER